MRPAARCTCCQARQAVRDKLEESRARAWAVAESMVAGWLFEAFGRLASAVEVAEGREEFWAWLAEQAPTG